MGHTKATEILLLGRKLGAHEAKVLGLVTEVLEGLDLNEMVQKKAEALVALPQTSLVEGKTLLRGWDKKMLHRVNREEGRVLEKLWQGEECLQVLWLFSAQTFIFPKTV